MLLCTTHASPERSSSSFGGETVVRRCEKKGAQQYPSCLVIPQNLHFFGTLRSFIFVLQGGSFCPPKRKAAFHSPFSAVNTICVSTALPCHKYRDGTHVIVVDNINVCLPESFDARSHVRACPRSRYQNAEKKTRERLIIFCVPAD